ncbi:SET domain-containing protein [Ceratobasidium sp. AG-Ba]|nr:SET domain-containing protein [Ceratobasidium sp. AG-Ba]
MDIFMPSIQGWGVRPLRSIKAGQVLGTFTGEILTREKAGNCTRYVSLLGILLLEENPVRRLIGIVRPGCEHKIYPKLLEIRYVSYRILIYLVYTKTLAGNWTRFINHSCDPNLKIYPVCYDTLPETGLERLAVVAVRDIPLAKSSL